MAAAPTRSDADIDADIRSHVIGDALGLDPDLVDVRVAQGVVKMTGVVENRRVAVRLRRLAAKVLGVRRIESSVTWGADGAHLGRMPRFAYFTKCNETSGGTHLSPRRVETLGTGVLVDPHRRRLLRRALGLEYATIGWNLGEAVLTIALGAVAGSLALIGFGSVSIIEVFASSVVVWHLMPAHTIDSPERTIRALRLVAVAFAALAVAVTVASIRDLVTARHPGESPWGIAYLAVTALVMFGLAVAKHRLANRLQSAPLRSEATMTFLDGILSTATMTGLALNAALSWWWADPAAALLVGVAAANEARENWREAAELEER